MTCCSNNNGPEYVLKTGTGVVSIRGKKPMYPANPETFRFCSGVKKLEKLIQKTLRGENEHRCS
jgi:hypothetical protein